MNLPTGAPEKSLHHTRGVYFNGEYKENGVLPEHLASHIAYNVTHRPGRALFVDGVCVHRGYLTEERCQEIVGQLVGVEATRCNLPYQ